MNVTKLCRAGTSKNAFKSGCRCFATSLRRAAPPTEVENIIRSSIKATGPMSVAMYMQLCLSHPTHGYYMNPANPIFGKAGDFITSPEISQVFGELLAIWHLSRWLVAGRPPRIRVVELGPGRGTLASDALRTWAQFPDACAALKEGSLHLVETSDAMRKLQEKTLRASGILDGLDVDEGRFVRWHEALDDLRESQSDVFTMALAHEFFDALPTHILEREQNGWREVKVTTDSSLDSKSISSTPNSVPSLRLAKSSESSTLSNFLGSLSPRYASLPVGSRLEVSPVGFKLVRALAEIVSNPRSAGGSALVIDYGWDGISGNSLRAFKKHKIADIFETPGECDLTANVDFALLKEAVRDAATALGPITQSEFLMSMGIEKRVEMLTAAKADADDGGREAIRKAAMRLVDPTGMGAQYKVLGITGCGGRKMDEEDKDVWPFSRPGDDAGAEGHIEEAAV